MKPPPPYCFYAYWSAEDQEWVGVCSEYPSMSWLHPIPSQALQGIKQLVADVEAGVA